VKATLVIRQPVHVLAAVFIGLSLIPGAYAAKGSVVERYEVASDSIYTKQILSSEIRCVPVKKGKNQTVIAGKQISGGLFERLYSRKLNALNIKGKKLTGKRRTRIKAAIVTLKKKRAQIEAVCAEGPDQPVSSVISTSSSVSSLSSGFPPALSASSAASKNSSSAASNSSGISSSAESEASSVPASLCGDGVCEHWNNENEVTCPQDCSPPGLQTDNDHDGLPDQWEEYYFNDPEDGVTPETQGPDDDPDQDGLTNLEEFQHRANPYMQFNQYAPDSKDTDLDGISDGDEVHLYHTNPLNPDTDGDGLSDYEEAFTRHSDPLHKDVWSYTFVDGQQRIHTRTQDGLKVHDDISGDLHVIPFIYYNLRPYEPHMGPNADPFTNVSAWEELKRGIRLWAEAGATEVSFFGSIDMLEDQDPDMPGYQNQSVDELEAIARQARAEGKNFHIIYGMGFGMWWYQFFDDPSSPGNQFARYGRAIRDLTQYTGSHEFLIEHEWPIYHHLIPAWQRGDFSFDAWHVQRLMENYSLVHVPGVRMDFYLPMYYTYPDSSELITSPDCENYQQCLNYWQSIQQPDRSGFWCENLIFQIFFGVYGSDFNPMYVGNQGFYAQGTYIRRRTVPYQEDNWAKGMFVQRELLGSHPVGLMLETWWPFRGNYGWPVSGEPDVSANTTCGPAETPAMLSYAFGRGLDKTNFPNLEFDHVYLYEDQMFESTAKMHAEYQKNGIMISMDPQDYRARPGTFKRGKYHSMIISVHREDQFPLTFSLQVQDQYGNVLHPSPDTYLFEVQPDRKTAVFSWIPGNNRSGYYWITFGVANGHGLDSTQSIPIRVG
jgi:hypothetical protein